jgi:hypothetical protein
MSITKYKISLDPAVLDRLRRHSPRRLDSRHVLKWRRYFADNEGFESARLGELTNDLKLLELIPVAEMTGAKTLTLFANPGPRCEADAEEAYRIEDVALTLVRLYWAGVKIPAMIFAGSLVARLKKKKFLTENELRVLWALSGKPVLPQRITIRWQAGDYTKHFEAATAKRLPDSRLSIRFLNPASEGVELIATAIGAKTRQDLAALGCMLERPQLNALIANRDSQLERHARDH